MGGFVLALGFIPATPIAFLIGFTFRMAAIWFGWEEPMPKVLASWSKAFPRVKPLLKKCSLAGNQKRHKSDLVGLT